MTCDEVRDLLPAYSLNSLEEEEQLQVEAHLEQCPDCALLLSQYQEVASRLSSLVVPVSPPAALKDRIVAAVSGAEEMHPLVRQRERARRPILIPLAGLAAALLLLGMSGGLAWTAVRINDLSRQNQELRVVLVQQEALDQEMEEALTQQRALAYMGAYPNSTTFLLRSPEQVSGSEGPTPRAMLLGNPEWGRALLVATGLPVLARDRVYQVWVLQGDVKLDGGTFTVDNTGYGQLALRLPQLLGAFDGIGITIEPMGGSVWPTSSSLLQGILKAPDETP